MQKSENKKINRKFTEYLYLEGKASGTIQEYSHRISLFERYLLHHGYQLIDTRPIDIRDYRLYLLAKGLAHQTINAHLSTLRVFFSWCQVEELIANTPVTDGLKLPVQYKKIERMSDSDLQTFKSWINTRQDNLRAAFWTMLGSGARVGEIATLTASDVIARDKAVYIVITDAKWGSDRTIPVIDPMAAKILWSFKMASPISGRALFRVKKRTLQFYATKFAKDTGIEFYCHLLRHTFASKLLENGVPITTIQFLLGHKNVNMTTHYTQSATIDTSGLVPQIF